MIQDQIERILTPQEGEEPIQDDGVSPIMPFPTSYELTRDQEEELVNHAMTRLEQLEKETGRDVCSGEWWGQDAQGVDTQDFEGKGSRQQTWMGKRHLYDLTYKNEVGWRSYLLGGIFAESNLVVPAARRICRQMIARAVNYFFGTDPWFAIYPVGALDRERADKADRYIRWKMDQAKLKRSQEQGIERAFIIGEAVMKTSWANRAQIYKTRAAVLVDEMGADILGADGDYILEDDPWIMEAAPDPATGEMIPSGMIVLKRDGVTPQPPMMQFVQKLITRRITHYKGPEAKVVNFMDFLCPLEAESIQQADCVVHLYDRPLMDLADEWKKSIEAGASAEEKADATRKAVDLLRTLAASSSQSKSNQNSGNVDSSTEYARADEQSQPIIEIAEFHLRYDCDGDGILEDVMLLVDRRSRAPIFYDYEANITADGLRPFTVVRVNEVPGRWYGIGAMEMFNTSQQIVDLLVNRWNFSNSKSARVDFWNPHNTIEGRANQNLELNWGGTYTPAPGKTAKDCLESVYLENQTGDQVQELSEFFMQLMTNESGVSNSNDAQLAGLETGKLATGVRNIEKSGQELFSLHLGHLEPGVSETLGKMVKLMMSRLDPAETHRYFEDGEGGEGTGEFREINAGDISNIELDTRILLSKYRSEQLVQSNMSAIDAAMRYYDPMVSPEVQARLAPLYRDILKAFQIQDADKMIGPLTQQQLPNATVPSGNANPAKAAQSVPKTERKSDPNL